MDAHTDIDNIRIHFNVRLGDVYVPCLKGQSTLQLPYSDAKIQLLTPFFARKSMDNFQSYIHCQQKTVGTYDPQG